MRTGRIQPMLFAVDVTSIEGETVLALRGELDLATQPRFMAALAGLDDRVARVVLDLSDLTFIDSATLRVINRAQLLAGLRGTEFVLRSANPHIVCMMELVGISPCAGDNGAQPIVVRPSSRGGTILPMRGDAVASLG